MKTTRNSLLTAAAILAVLTGVSQLDRESRAMAEEKSEPMLAHMVFFTLKDSSDAGRAALVAACDKYLSDHPGTVYYSAGVRAPDLNRPVNDADFDVALHVVFKTRADHDRYQTADKHLKFIEENKATWKQVRVFDSNVK